MRRQRWSAVLAAIGLAASVALGVSQAEPQGAPIRVGSKNFTESIVFAHFIAEVLNPTASRLTASSSWAALA